MYHLLTFLIKVNQHFSPKNESKFKICQHKSRSPLYLLVRYYPRSNIEWWSSILWCLSSVFQFCILNTMLCFLCGLFCFFGWLVAWFIVIVVLFFLHIFLLEIEFAGEGFSLSCINPPTGNTPVIWSKDRLPWSYCFIWKIVLGINLFAD